MKKIDVIYQFNDLYAPYAGISITSLFCNNKHLDKIRIYILGEQISKENITKFKKLGNKYGHEIIFVETDSLIEKMKEMKVPLYRGSYAASMRLFLTEVLDDTVDKLLYLDADTIVKGKLDDLIEMDMKNYPLGMVFDSVASIGRTFIGFKLEDAYFNSGVILFQMSEWRRQALPKQICNYIIKKGVKFSAPDQDILNVVCKGKILTLDPKYNFQPLHIVSTAKDYLRFYLQGEYYDKEVIEAAQKNPVIYHFFRYLGEFPWNKDSIHPDTKLFDSYLKVSLWKDYNKKKAKKNLLVKIETIMYKVLPRICFLLIFRFAHRYFSYKAHLAAQKGRKYSKY